MGPPPCQVVAVKSMSSLFGHLRWDPAFSLDVSWIRLRREPPSLRMEFPDESSNVSSLGRSATADARPPAVIKMTAFVDLYRSRESGELLRFKGCAKSQYMGFAVKMFECIGSE